LLQSLDSLVIISSAFDSDSFQDIAPEDIVETYDENANSLEQISAILAEYTDIQNLYVIDTSEIWSAYLEKEPNLAQSFGDYGNLLLCELFIEQEIKPCSNGSSFDISNIETDALGAKCAKY